MRLFRWLRKNEEAAPSEAAAPETTQEVPPAAESGPEQARTRRRRGTRGGRGRKKSSEQTTAAAAEAAAPAERKPAQPERKPARPEQRQPPRPEQRQRPERRRRIQPRRAPLPAAKRELLISVDVGEQRAAVLEDDAVAEVYLERPERRSIAGNIYLGTVDNVLPGMEAAFVEIGLEKNGFLYVDEIVVPELEGKRHGKKIQDLLNRGQTILVQAVKDPMKSKGARLTTEISLPGRFVVFVPQGEGLGVSRRLPDEERARLKEVIKGLEVPEGGVIVRTAAEGASAEDVERDLLFLQRLWKTIQARAAGVAAPALVYQEAELPLRVIRDLFTNDFERALVDHERTHKRIVGYLKKTSPHMVERVVRYREKTPLMEASGVDGQIRSTLSRRVDLPSGGYLVFDYAEAFTVIDVNTGRFVGSRSKGSGAKLEDTITKNNLEAVKEVVRQLRLRDIGGIIVIDFIDMANPKNRATVEEALRAELERDRTKTYVVEISPLGLVEMTRQNVTDGPREILTRKCPVCAGDGVVVSEASAAIDIERRLRVLAAGSRAQAFRVELHPRVRSIVVGPGASRLTELEAQTKRRFFLEEADGGHGVDHFAVLAQGKLEELRPPAPVAEGQELDVPLVEVALHDRDAAVGKVDGFDVCVAGAAKLVGKKVKVRVERVLDGSAYATWVDAPAQPEPPITAEAEAEKPTRQPRARKTAPAPEAAEETEKERRGDGEATDAATADAEGEEAQQSEAPAKKRTRRGTRGGRGRKRSAAEAASPAADAAAEDTAGAPEATVAAPEATEAALPPADAAPEAELAETDSDGKAVGAPAELPAPRIHVPEDALGREKPDEGEGEGDPRADGDAPKPKKRTRRGTRGGRGRKRKAEDAGGAVAVAEEDGAGDATPAVPEAADAGYVPMSEWEDEL